MIATFEKWLDVYGRWDSNQQLLLACLAALLAFILAVGAGVWIIHVIRSALSGIASIFHGHPVEGSAEIDFNRLAEVVSDIATRRIEFYLDEKRAKDILAKFNVPYPGQQISSRGPYAGQDWRAESQQMREEARFQREAQAKLQDEMKQSSFETEMEAVVARHRPSPADVVHWLEREDKPVAVDDEVDIGRVGTVASSKPETSITRRKE